MKSKDKKIKKRYIIIILIVILLSVILGGYLFVRNLPVDYDAGACGGGYDTYIFDKYSDELVQKYVNASADKDDISSVKAIKGTQKAEWEEKKIFLTFDIEYEHNSQGRITERLHFTGQRIWFDTYDWSGATIEILHYGKPIEEIPVFDINDIDKITDVKLVAGETQYELNEEYDIPDIKDILTNATVNPFPTGCSFYVKMIVNQNDGTTSVIEFANDGHAIFKIDELCYEYSDNYNDEFYAMFSTTALQTLKDYEKAK